MTVPTDERGNPFNVALLIAAVRTATGPHLRIHI